MKTINISTKAKTINSLLRKATGGGLILRSPEGREFILAEIDDFDREIELTRQNKALMKFLDSRGKQTKVDGKGSSPLLAFNMSYKGDEAVFMVHSLRIEYPVGYCHFINRSHSRGEYFLGPQTSKAVFRFAFQQFAATEDGHLYCGEMTTSVIS